MPKKKAQDAEYCRGYFDEHGQWNNGFKCPRWGGPDIQYCCGPETHRYCCTKQNVQNKPPALITATEISVIMGAAVGCLVLVSVSAILTCYFCQCCWVYKKRKRHSQGGSTSSHPHVTGGRPVDYAVNYTAVCPHQPYMSDGIQRDRMYPLDDPPPYPGDAPFTPEEKQPLNPTDLYVTQDGPDDTPVTMALPSDPNNQPIISLNGAISNGLNCDLDTELEPGTLAVNDSQLSNMEPISGTSSSFTPSPTIANHSAHVSISSGNLCGYHGNNSFHQTTNNDNHGNPISLSKSSPQLSHHPVDLQIHEALVAECNEDILAQVNIPRG